MFYFCNGAKIIDCTISGKVPDISIILTKQKQCKKVKKIALSLVIVAACAGAFGAYESYQQSGESDALLAENVEAMSNTEWAAIAKYAAKSAAKSAKSIITPENIKKAAKEVGKQFAVGEIIDGIGSFLPLIKHGFSKGV